MRGEALVKASATVPPSEDDAHRPEPAVLARIRQMVPDHRLFEVRFKDPKLNERFEHRPGQFVMLSVFGTGEAPFSISSSPTREAVELCIRRVGRVTDALYRLDEGAPIGLRGPYGNGFPVEEMKGSDLLLVAGGLGFAPLRSLLWYVLDKREDYGRIVLMYGTKSTAELLFEWELDELMSRDDLESYFIVEKVEPGHESTWKGSTGLVTQLFDEVELDPKSMFTAICGPPVMYKFVLQELMKRDFPKDKILMSLERKMKCGIGKCAHCAVGHKYTCLDGPIFTYWDAMQLPEMI